MRAAYDGLDEALRKRPSTELSAYHSLRYSQAKLSHASRTGAEYRGYGARMTEPPLRPLVKAHPETGQRALVIGRHAFGIPGLESGESERLLEELAAFACQPPRVWRHAWSPGDVVLWDNRCLMHRGAAWDMRQPRVLHHARIAGDPASEFAAHA